MMAQFGYLSLKCIGFIYKRKLTSTMHKFKPSISRMRSSSQSVGCGLGTVCDA